MSSDVSVHFEGKNAVHLGFHLSADVVAIKLLFILKASWSLQQNAVGLSPTDKLKKLVRTKHPMHRMLVNGGSLL